MPVFKYKAITASGEISEGEMEAASEQAVIERLKEIGVDYAQGYEIMHPQSMELELKQLSEHTRYKLHGTE